ncbi:MAG: hypothetical protein H6855_04500 [Rhodospirillales bacterium]|nr:hypothetical protein [Rhodospirillales bacterium]MCB9973166.1 hypothetical protein [Rhodospirillales bacterium]
MTWQILDKPRTLRIIGAVKANGLGNLFDPATTEARVRTLPFYRNIKLYRLTNYATLPAFSLFYLGDDENYTYLDGGFEGIRFYNTEQNLILNKETVLPYLDFYFIFVAMDAGEIGILGARDQYHILEEFPSETEVKFDAERNLFMIKIPLYFDGSLMIGSIEITSEGVVTITDTKMSMQAQGRQALYETTTDY